MTINKKLENLKKFVSEEPSDFLSKFAYYEKNQLWLDRSSEIAVNILEALRDKNLSQKDLAEKMEISAQQVSKIIKGQQNLTLETISKIEDALNISLMHILDYKGVNTIEVRSSTSIKSGNQRKETIVTSNNQNNIEDFDRNSISKKSTSMTIVYKAEEKILIAV